MDKIKGAYVFFWDLAMARIKRWLQKIRLQVFLWDLTMIRRNEKAKSFFLGIW